jgi:hypothetical protein
MKVGFGYDLLQGSPLASPAVLGTISSIQGAGGQEVQSHLLRIDDSNAMHEALGVNIDAGGSYLGVSADVKVDFAKECNVSQHSTHVLTGVTVRDAFENFDAPVLSTEAEELLKNQNPGRFHDRFGDVFIGGLLKGGEYFAVFEINSVDQSVRERIAGHIEAAFNSLFAAAHLSVDIENEKSATSSHTEVRVHVWQKGSIDHTDQSMEEILRKAHDFPPSVAGDKAAPFAVSLVDYKTLRLPVDRFNFLDIANQRDVLAEHAQKRFAFLDLRNTINYIRKHPEDFVDPDLESLARQSGKVTEAINIMQNEASACLRDASACRFTPFDVADFPLPKPKPTSLPLGPTIQAGPVSFPDFPRIPISRPHSRHDPFQVTVRVTAPFEEPSLSGFNPNLLARMRHAGIMVMDDNGFFFYISKSVNNQGQMIAVGQNLHRLDQPNVNIPGISNFPHEQYTDESVFLRITRKLDGGGHTVTYAFSRDGSVFTELSDVEGEEGFIGMNPDTETVFLFAFSTDEKPIAASFAGLEVVGLTPP